MEIAKQFDGCILDEIISIFNNNIIICGSLCDYAHINYAGEIADFDFIIQRFFFFKYFNITEFPDIIEFRDFKLKIKKNKFIPSEISYFGKYKDVYIVDFFIESEISIAGSIQYIVSESNSSDCSTQILFEHDLYTAVSSNIFCENSQYDKYLINSFHARKKRIEELSVFANKKQNEDLFPEWRKAQCKWWREKKIRQVDEKLPIYNEYELKQSNKHINC
jgi:hypothetical protein